MAFMDEKYLIGNATGLKLYDEVRQLPVIDGHNHADVKALVENKPFADLWQAEAGTDHYVWEMMRKRGVQEYYITGAADNDEKWLMLCNVFEEFAGNPTFEWIHLDLRRCLGIEDLICAANAKKIWDTSQKLLGKPGLRPQALLKSMRVERMCSTDDPIDSLEYHRQLATTPLAGVVRPTFRPDKAMNIFRKDWNDYIVKLEECVGTKFKTVADLVAGLKTRHDFFAENGCVASDHGVETPFGYAVDAKTADTVFKKARDGKALDESESSAFMSFLLTEVAEMDAGKNWVFQLHIGAVRDVRSSLFKNLGPDTGGDISDHLTDIVQPLRDFLNRFDNRLKVVLYSMEPNHQTTLATLSRAFGEKVSLGSAWWLNDSPVGMRRQLEYIGSVDLLWNFAGMVSDSRKLFSYGSRHEMFRRVLCDVVGNQVERGQIPQHLAERLVTHLCYKRPKELFGL